MYIQQSHQFRYSQGFNNFYFFENESFVSNNNLGYLSLFLNSDFGSIENNLEQQIKYYFVDNEGTGFQTTEVSIDHKNNLVYIGEMPDPCDYEDEDYPFIDGKTSLEHFQEGILESAHLTKNNFFYILRTWNKYLEEQPPFLLLYQDENDLFDLKPFQSKEEMDQFVKDHTPIMN